MSTWTKALGKWTVLAVVAGAGLGIEFAPTLASHGAQARATGVAATLLEQSSCAAAAYADAQRIGGGLLPPAPRGACTMRTPSNNEGGAQ